MSKIRDAQTTLNQLENLVGIMYDEIEQLRNMVYRHTLIESNIIKGGRIDPIPDNIYFNIDYGICSDVFKIRVLDSKEIGIDSNYQKIKKLLKSLEL